MFVLQLKLKDGSVREYPLKSMPVVLGRAKGVQIQISHKSISPEHVRLHEEHGQLHVEDMTPSGGLFVNGKPVTKGLLKAGDSLRAGAAVFNVASVATKPSSSQDVEEFVLPTDENEKTQKSSHKTASEKPITYISSGGKEARKKDAHFTPQSPTDIKVKQDILQFHRIESKKGRSFLKDDFAQYGGSWRILLWCGFLALALGTFFLFKWLGSTVTPDEMGAASEYQAGEEDESFNGE